MLEERSTRISRFRGGRIMKRIAIACVRAVANVPLKIKASFGLLVFAMLMAIIKSRIDATWCLIAMLFCFAGDIALNHDKDRSKRSTNDFIVGMLMFMLAHVAYAITYFMRIREMYPESLAQGINWTLFIVVDWSKVNKEDYLLAMERSPIKDVEIKELIKQALTNRINDREIYMKGIDASYYYEGYTTYRTEDL